MRGKFQVILSADEVGVGKPSPDVYLETARCLGVAPEQCLCLEDSGTAFWQARAGMIVIAVPDARFASKQETLDQAHLVLSSLTELSLNNS